MSSSEARLPSYRWQEGEPRRRRTAGLPFLFGPSDNDWVGPRQSVVATITLECCTVSRAELGRAWSGARFAHPSIACRFDVSYLPDVVLAYDSPESQLKADAWVAETLISHEETADSADQPFEDFLNGRLPLLEPLSVLHVWPDAQCSTTLHLGIVISHALADSYGALLVLDSFLKALASPEASLAWGSEHSRLQLSVAGMTGIRKDGQHLSKQQEELVEKLTAPIGMRPKYFFGSHGLTPVDKTNMKLHGRLTIHSKEDSAVLFAAAKKLGQGVGELLMHLGILAYFRAACRIEAQHLPTAQEAEQTWVPVFIAADQRRWMPKVMQTKTIMGVGLGACMSTNFPFVELAAASKAFDEEVAAGQRPPRPFVPAMRDNVSIVQNTPELPLIDEELLDRVIYGLGKKLPDAERPRMFILSVLGRLDPYIATSYGSMRVSACRIGTISREVWQVYRCWTFDSRLHVHLIGNKAFQSQEAVDEINAELHRMISAVNGR